MIQGQSNSKVPAHGTLHQLELLHHLLHSPNLASRDFHLFRYLKEHLGGKQFATDSDIQQVDISWLKALDTDLFHAGIDALAGPGGRAV
jgi:hypothetical protein